MARQRSRTLVEHLGFNDPDLKSPAHDVLILWIADHIREYVEKGHDSWRGIAKEVQHGEDAIQAELSRRRDKLKREQEYYENALTPRMISLYPKPEDRTGNYRDDYRPIGERMETPEEIQKRTERPQKDVEEAQAKCLETERLVGRQIPRPAEAPPVKIKTEFEKTITTSREFIVGFVDVVAEVDYPSVYAAHLDWSQSRDSKIQGYERPPELRFATRREFFYFEAKPKIPSLGELLRQIRTYQEYLPRYEEYSRERRPNHFVIVSPDTRFRAALESQGIEFWESPPL